MGPRSRGRRPGLERRSLRVSSADVPGYWREAVSTTDEHGARAVAAAGADERGLHMDRPHDPTTSVQGLYDYAWGPGAHHGRQLLTRRSDSPGRAGPQASRGHPAPGGPRHRSRATSVSPRSPSADDLDLAAGRRRGTGSGRSGGHRVTGASRRVTPSVQGDAEPTAGPATGELSSRWMGATAGPSLMPRSGLVTLVGDGTAVPDLVTARVTSTARVPFAYAADPKGEVVSWAARTVAEARPDRHEPPAGARREPAHRGPWPDPGAGGRC